MTKITSLHAIAGALLAYGLSAAPAHALAGRTFVSGKGTDSGTCALTAPCRTFAFALTQTAAGGEIDVLDPAGYGTMTITKSISIVNDGVGVAGIHTSSVNAITTISFEDISVHLRGLTIDGLGRAANGIQFLTGGNLAIENCVIRGFAGNGIAIQSHVSSSFSVSNTIASNNGGFGILVQPTGSATSSNGVLSKVITNTNGLAGILVVGTFTTRVTSVTIVDSEASNNVGSGVRAVADSLSTRAQVSLHNVVASYNNVGLETGLGGLLLVAHSVVKGNRTGVSKADGGVIESYGDNYIGPSSFSDGLSDLTPIPMH